MRHKAPKILLLITVSACLSLYAAPSSYGADPYINRKTLESTVSKVISAIMENKAAGLMTLSKMPGSFQFGKEDHITRRLKGYFNKTIETRKIEVTSMEVLTNEKARVTALVHLSAINSIDDTKTKPRNEVWNFVKGEKGSLRGKWILVLE